MNNAVRRIFPAYSSDTCIPTDSFSVRDGSSPPKKFKRVHSAEKVMASIFWNSQGVIMIDYLEQGCTINSAYYAGKLRRLEEIARKRQENLTCGEKSIIMSLSLV